MTHWCCDFNEDTNRVEAFAPLWLQSLFDTDVCLVFGINPGDYPPTLGRIAYLYLCVQTKLQISPASSRGGSPTYGIPLCACVGPLAPC